MDDYNHNQLAISSPLFNDMSEPTDTGKIVRETMLWMMHFFTELNRPGPMVPVPEYILKSMLGPAQLRELQMLPLLRNVSFTFGRSLHYRTPDFVSAIEACIAFTRGTELKKQCGDCAIGPFNKCVVVYKYRYVKSAFCGQKFLDGKCANCYYTGAHCSASKDNVRSTIWAEKEVAFIEYMRAQKARLDEWRASERDNQRVAELTFQMNERKRILDAACITSMEANHRAAEELYRSGMLRIPMDLINDKTYVENEAVVVAGKQYEEVKGELHEVKEEIVSRRKRKRVYAAPAVTEEYFG